MQFYYKSRVDNTYIDSMFSSWLDQELINFQIYLQGYLFIIIYIALTAITRLHRWQKKLKCTFLCKWWGEYLIFYIKAYKNICSFIEIIVLLLLKVFIKKEYKTPFLLTESLPWLALISINDKVDYHDYPVSDGLRQITYSLAFMKNVSRLRNSVICRGDFSVVNPNKSCFCCQKPL